MHSSRYPTAGLLALALLAGFIIAWETYLRREGYQLGYNDDEALWAYHHGRIYQTSAANPVIIGSSRVKFGIDLPTWEAAAGAAPVQLAMMGTSPRPVLTDLARDARFKGAVLVGVTEALFFTPTGGFSEQQANKGIAYYPKWSPAQRAGFHINRALESRLLFLDEEHFALRKLLPRLRVPNRPGVFTVPPFPIRFTTGDFNRQTALTPEFLADTSQQNEQRAIWMHILTKAPKMPMPDSVLTGIFADTRAAVAKIRARGGKVVFVRMPSTGEVWELEKKEFPREKYWNRLLKETGAPGIHFADFPGLARYACPEWSHLSPADARTFTRDLVRIMARQDGLSIGKGAAPVAAPALAATSSTSTSR